MFDQLVLDLPGTISLKDRETLLHLPLPIKLC